MVILGLVLIGLGALAIVAAVFTTSDKSVALLGIDMSPLALFLVGVVAGAFILWGWSILKYGTKRELAQRRERKKLGELSEKLDRVESERKREAEEG